jgi:hypothetical protein
LWWLVAVVLVVKAMLQGQVVVVVCLLEQVLLIQRSHIQLRLVLVALVLHLHLQTEQMELIPYLIPLHQLVAVAVHQEVLLVLVAQVALEAAALEEIQAMLVVLEHQGKVTLAVLD